MKFYTEISFYSLLRKKKREEWENKHEARLLLSFALFTYVHLHSRACWQTASPAEC